MAIPALNDFHLAGGTSLALQIGHRLSFDLDFFGQRPFETNEILDLIHPLGAVSILSQSANIIVLNVDDIKVDFVNYRYPTIRSIIVDEGIRLYSKEDIGAMKLSAITGRGKRRDFYDLFFLLEHFDLKQLMQFYEDKFPDGSDLMVLRSLTFFDDAEQDEDVQLIRNTITWKDVKECIRKKAHALI